MTNPLSLIRQLALIELPRWATIEAAIEGPVALKTNGGIDHVARAVGGDIAVGESGTATSVTSSAPYTLTASATFPTTAGGYAGHVVVAGPNSSGTGSTVYGVIISNTSTILTIDYWRATATPNATGTTPNGTCTYCILPGGGPAWYMGLTANTNAADATDTMLATTAGGTSAAEIWHSGGGLNRVKATYSHTNGTATYALSNVFTANGSDGASNTINKIGIFVHGGAQLAAAPSSTTSGTMLYTTVVTSGPTLISGDQLTLTDTVTIT